MAVTDKGRKRGRPRIPDSKAKRSAIGFRITARIRKRLEDAANETGRSLSQEAETRLEQSFYSDREYGGAQQRALFRALAAVAAVIEERTGKSWIEDGWTAVAVSKAWRVLIKDFRPIPDLDKDVESILEGLPTKPHAPDIEGPKRPVVGLRSRATPEEMSNYDRRSDEDFKAMDAYALELAEYGLKLADGQEQILRYVKDVSERIKESTKLGSDVARSLFPNAEQD